MGWRVEGSFLISCFIWANAWVYARVWNACLAELPLPYFFYGCWICWTLGLSQNFSSTFFYWKYFWCFFSSYFLSSVVLASGFLTRITRTKESLSWTPIVDNTSVLLVSFSWKTKFCYSTSIPLSSFIFCLSWKT